MSPSPKHVKVIGCGGVGTWLIHAIAPQLSFHAPESQLTLVDGDTFEPKNKERQLFDSSKPGAKSTVVAREIRPQFPNIFINDIAAWVVADGHAAVKREGDEDGPIGKVDVSDLMDENDIIILSVDNNDTRKLFFEAAVKFRNIDIYSGGNGDLETGDALTGSVYHYRRRDGADVTGSPLFYHAEEYENAVGHNPGEMSCAERAKLKGGTQLVVANMTVAAIMMSKIYLTSFCEDQKLVDASLEQTEIFFDWTAGRADWSPCPPPKGAIEETTTTTVDVSKREENEVLA